MATSDALIAEAAGASGNVSDFDLDITLPSIAPTAREVLQGQVQCGMVPMTPPLFVDRARATDTLDAHGGPVDPIAGNGHARTDRGVPASIARVRPLLRVVALVQSEGIVNDVPPGDIVLTSPPAYRSDPCAAFR